MKLLSISFPRILIASTVLCSSFAFAKDNCVPKEEYDSFLSQYTFEVLDADGEVAKTLGPSDRCQLGENAKIFEGLTFLKKLPRYKNTPSEFQTLISEQGPIPFFNKRIKTIQFETDSSSCKVGVIAFIRTYEAPDKILHYCPLASGSRFNTPLMIGGVLLHEARHIDGIYHVYCKRGGSAARGIMGCDNNYQEQGGYGIGAGYLFYIYKGTKNEVLRDEARSMAVDSVLANFNKAPLDVKPGALLLAKDNVYFHDGTLYYVSEFDGEKVQAIGADIRPYYYFSNGDVQEYNFDYEIYTVSGNLPTYYSKLTQQERNSLLDVKSSTKYTCLLWPRYVRCLYDDRFFIEKRFNVIDPQNFYESDIVDITQIQILDKSGKVYILPEDPEDLKSLSDRDYESYMSPFPNLTGWVTLENGSNLGLTKSGTVLRKDSGKWYEDEEAQFAQGQTFRKMIPFMWSLRLLHL